MVEPQEIQVWYVLPAIRKELTLNLIEQGLKQKEIANLLSLTESAVSQYKKEKRAKELSLPSKIKDLVKISATTIKNNPKIISLEIQKLTKAVTDTGFLCELHKKSKDGYFTELKGCESCFNK